MPETQQRCGTCRWFAPMYKSMGPWCDWPEKRDMPIAMPDEVWTTREQAGTTCPCWEARPK